MSPTASKLKLLATFRLLACLALLSALAASPQAPVLAANQKQLLDQGYLLLKKRDYPQAKAKFAQALKENPNSLDCLWGRAQSLMATTDEAVDMSLGDRMIKLAPNDYRGYLYKSRYYLRKKDHKSANRYADLALKRNSNCALAYMAKAQARFIMGEFAEQDATNESTDYVRTALSIDPNVENGNTMLGAVLATQKKFKDAIKLFDKAIVNDPTNKKNYEYRCMAYAALGEIEKSLVDVNKVIELEPDSWRHYILRAQTYEQLKKFDKAMADYDKGISLHPEHYRTRFYRASLAFKLGKYKICIDDYSAILNANALDDDALKMRGDCYTRTEQFKKALYDYNEAIDLSPESMSYYRARADLFDRLGEKGKALADRKKADQLKTKKAVDKI